MSILIEQEVEQVKASVAFHAHADLNAIYLLASKSERGTDWDRLKQPIRLEFKHTPRYAHVGKEGAEIHTAFRFRAIDSSPGMAQALLVECTFQANYSLAARYKPSSAEIEAFQSGNAIFNAWPFFREFVQTNVSRMGLPIPPVPFLRLIPKRHAEPETNVESRPVSRKKKARAKQN
jgi:hypothetical protein